MNIQLYKTKQPYKVYEYKTTINNMWKVVCSKLDSIKWGMSLKKIEE